MMQKILLIFLVISTGVIFPVESAAKPAKKARNIILFIGDGMGTAQIYSGITVSPQALYLESFPYSGFSKTFASDNYITDSAAGGTAIACGIKTKNGMIGMGPDSVAVSSIIELARRDGLATGVISTSAVTHATPASFVSHNAGRGNYEDIAKDFLNGNLDLFIGGGQNHFKKRADGDDLTVKLKEQGFDVVYTMDDLKNTKSSKIAGLLAPEHMPQATEGRAGMLREMTVKAIETLKKDKDGFFLMVEGSMIDWGCHAKDIVYAVNEVLDLDDAIGAAREFAESDGKTLVVVTADHETGGLTLVGGNMEERSLNAGFIQSGSHTAVMVPIFSYGPGAERFSGIHDNTFFFTEFLNLLRIKK